MSVTQEQLTAMRAMCAALSDREGPNGPWAISHQNQQFIAATDGVVAVMLPASATDAPAAPEWMSRAVRHWLSLAFEDAAIVSAADLSAFGVTPEPEPVVETCTQCRGSRRVKCAECDGDGETECECSSCGDEHKTSCDKCDGDGDIECKACSEPVAKAVQSAVFVGGVIDRAALGAALAFIGPAGSVEVRRCANGIFRFASDAGWIAFVMGMWSTQTSVDFGKPETWRAVATA